MEEEALVVQLMTEAEARQVADSIRRGMANVGQLLLDFHERDGWAALGYENWRECAMTEFGYGQAYVYKLLEAARVERNIYTIVEKPMSPIVEAHLRPLAPLGPEAQREVWTRAVETAPQGKVTAKHVEKTVQEWKYNQGVEYGSAASMRSNPEPEDKPIDDDDDIPKTVTLRVARVIFLMTLGRHMSIDDIAKKTSLSENGAWRLMDRLAGGRHVPVTTDDEGRWCILEVDLAEMPY